MTTPSSIAPGQQVQDLIPSTARLNEIEDLCDRITDPAARRAVTDLLDYVAGLEWLVLGDEGPSLRKVDNHLHILGGIRRVYERRVARAVADGRQPAGHEAASVVAVEWAVTVLRRLSSARLARPVVGELPD